MISIHEYDNDRSIYFRASEIYEIIQHKSVFRLRRSEKFVVIIYAALIFQYRAYSNWSHEKKIVFDVRCKFDTPNI